VTKEEELCLIPQHRIQTEELISFSTVMASKSSKTAILSKFLQKGVLR
jgi:hypothetical protein